ncbi:MAG: M23 family metallopeptidase [Nitrospina sp.]|nr:M23 family metallopeptidase [Nitrospina sp.]
MRGRIQLLGWCLVLVFALAGCQGFEYKGPSHDGPGVYHTVRAGNTLSAIAETYACDIRVLQVVNGIRDPHKIYPGQRIWIPNALRVLEVPVLKPGSPQVAGRSPAQKKRAPSKKKFPKPAVVRPGYLMWPVQGVLTSGYGRRGSRNHEGIDIGAKSGTPIRASAGGVVKFSGWGPTGYGKMIIIKHPNELTTVYAHNDRNLVPKGRTVNKGQVIALVGSTGRSTGPHLHFEVRNHTHPKNPLKYLPGK